MALSKRLRFEVFKRDDFTCQYCGRRAGETELHVDHVIPRFVGGGDDFGNLVTACADCNLGKGAVPLLNCRRFPLDPKRLKTCSIEYCGRSLVVPEGGDVLRAWTCEAEHWPGDALGVSLAEWCKHGWAMPDGFRWTDKMLDDPASDPCSECRQERAARTFDEEMQWRSWLDRVYESCDPCRNRWNHAQPSLSDAASIQVYCWHESGHMFSGVQ